MALWAAFHYAATGGASEASQENSIEKTFEKSSAKSVPPHMALKAAGAHRRLSPGIFFPKKAYLLEIHVNK